MSIQDIKQNYRIEEVVGRSISLKRQGPELVGNCPFHDDHQASMKINPVKQIYKCFACGAGGDMFDFFTQQGYEYSAAKNLITNGGIIAVSDPSEKIPEIIWKDAIPNQEQLPDVSKLVFKDYGNPSRFWAYKNAEGKTCGYVLRFDLPDGKKDVIPYTFKKRITEGNSTNGWFWKGFEIKRPLYNLEDITLRPNAIVLMVEGEKTADAAKKLFPQYVCTTWIGGGENVKNADLSPLEGRNIYLWADNDTPGIHCMFGGWAKNEKTGVYRRIQGVTDLVSANFKRISNSKDFPKKWDVADADWTPEEALAYLKENRTEIPSVSEHAPNEIPEPVAVKIETPPIPVVPIEKKPVQDRDESPKNNYFKCLGFENNGDQNLFVFFVYRTNVIVKLSAGGISGSNILQLAPLNYWEGQYPKQSRSGPVKYEISTIADNLITACSKIGIFNPSKIRGRGAWMDAGKSVIHCGDTLIVDGKYTDFSQHKSKFIYEAGEELGFNLVNPLEAKEAFKLIQVLERLNWSREVNARLLAGWIVVAPFCGALKWRPHLWLTGASGAGKSWIMNSPVKKLMGTSFVDAQSETTEAGIRQFLKADALPVIFDEAESEDRKAQERMQSVLNIMRSSSTSDSGKIIKGSSGGTAHQFSLRSCFAFASIGANLTQRSDISRITVLEIKPDNSADKKTRWVETQKMFREIDSEDYVHAFQSRSLKLLPIILENAVTFSIAAAAELDNQRAGDQLGALLAGAYSLTSSKLISFEDASKWIKERDWSEERLMDSTRDEVRLINLLMGSEIDLEGLYGKSKRTVGEMIRICSGDLNRNLMEESIFPIDNVVSALNRLGMKVESKNLIVSDSSQHIRKLLYNTSYSNNYPMILSRMNGSEKTEDTVFASYTKTRATKIPLIEIFGQSEIKPDTKKEEKRIAEIQQQLNLSK